MCVQKIIANSASVGILCIVSVGLMGGCRQDDTVDSELRESRNMAVTIIALGYLVDDLNMASSRRGTRGQHVGDESDLSGQPPSDNHALVQLIEQQNIPVPEGLQIKNGILLDAWHEPVHVLAVDGGWTIGSGGPDGTWNEGEGDDIVSFGIVGTG